MTDLGWTIAAILGFALVCVMTVVYLMSKRQITVNQHQENHAAPVTVNAGGDGDGLGIAPALIGWVFKLLVAGIVLTIVANLIMTGVNGIGQGLQRIGDGLGRQAAPQPQPIVVNYPTPQPVQRLEPQYVPQAAPKAAPVEVEWLPIAVVALAVMAVGLWGYVAVTLLRRKPIKRSNVITPTGYTHPAFDAAARNVNSKARN